ncbi:MAG TPA: efflux RND transporter permease subunit [Chthoniobacteraceae bacterium]|nr:efflux RND transporter permease subunit [Chthoniobacteraceae bacterium]
MHFTDLFIRRPVVATVVSLIILLAGLQSIRQLNVRQYPRSDIAVITVKTAYVGANADLVRGFITTPLERVIASADGIDFIESSSAQGMSTISVNLKLNYDTNAALTQIQAKIAQVRNQLPPEAEAPVIDLQTTDNQIASMYLSFYTNDLDQNQITDYLTRVVQPKLTAVAGVQRADILGARTFAMRIWLDSERLAALNISPSEVRAALASNNYLSAIGATKGSMISVNLVANTDLRTPAEFRKLVVRERDGVIIRLEDVANVTLGAESYDDDVRFSGQQATFIGVWVLPTSNSLDVIAAVRDQLPDIERQLPQNMRLSVAYDATEYIRDAINEVVHTLGETLVIVVVVIFFFLGSLRSVLIPVVAIPISLIGACFLMLVFGFTLNLLTLLAIVLAVGLVVDDAIVVVENVERYLQLGFKPTQAAFKAARELAGPIIAMTITLAAVYAPIGLQGGLTGTLFREFAFTLAGAVLVSGVVALTLSPMMSAKLLRAGDSHRGYAGWINRHFDRLRRFYMRLLQGTLRWRPVTITLALLIIALIFPFFLFSASELAPKEDQGFIMGIVQGSPNSTIDQTVLFTEQVADAFASMPETDNFFQVTNPTGGFAGLVTKPWSQRSRSTDEINMELSGKVGAIAGVRTITMTPSPLPGAGNFPVDFAILSTAEPQELLDFANQLVAHAYKTGLFIYADTDLKYDQPQSEIVFDRDKVASLGLNLQQVGADLGTLLGGNYVNWFSIQGRSYKVIPQITRIQRLTVDQLKDYYVSGPNQQLVQLSTFATVKTTTEPRTLNRLQQLNSARIQGVIPPGVSLDKALSALEEEAARILPKGYSIDYVGESRQLRVEGNSLYTTMALSLILIFLVLAAQFESFRDPFIILAGSVPLAISGALFFSFMGFTTLNIYSQVGLITLVGLVSKNGILIVEFANHLQQQGLSKMEAAIEAAGTRLRPILMTTVATVVGHFPLIIASGPGAGSRNSIGMMLVTGMIIGTIFTLFVVPTIYTVLARTHRPEDAVELPDESEQPQEAVPA